MWCRHLACLQIIVGRLEARTTKRFDSLYFPKTRERLLGVLPHLRTSILEKRTKGVLKHGGILRGKARLSKLESG